MRESKRFETQKVPRGLRLIHHRELSKGIGVWDFEFGGGNSQQGEKRKSLVNKGCLAVQIYFL